MEELMQEITSIQCPKHVDVVGPVMDSIKAKQLLAPSSRRRFWLNIATGFAASFLIAFIVNISLFFSHPYSEKDINTMFAELDQYTLGYNTPDAVSEDYNSNINLYFGE